MLFIKVFTISISNVFSWSMPISNITSICWVSHQSVRWVCSVLLEFSAFSWTNSVQCFIKATENVRFQVVDFWNLILLVRWSQVFLRILCVCWCMPFIWIRMSYYFFSLFIIWQWYQPQQVCPRGHRPPLDIKATQKAPMWSAGQALCASTGAGSSSIWSSCDLQVETVNFLSRPTPQ